jgi:hypothetical protein
VFLSALGIKQKAVTTHYHIKWHINKNLHRVSEEFFGIIKERERRTSGDGGGGVVSRVLLAGM